MNKQAIDYGNGIIWYFDNYPRKYEVQKVGWFYILVELPSQTLWL